MGVMIGNSLDNALKYEKMNSKNIGKTIWNYMKKDDINSEEEKTEYESNLYKKINSGKKLTNKEISYVKKNMPQVYPQVLKAQNMRKTMEKKCENAQSKQEVDQIYFTAMNQVSDKDPDREMIRNVIRSVVNEFKKSNDYKGLPEKTEEEEGKSSKRKKDKTQYFTQTGNYQEAFSEGVINTFSIEV